MNKTPPKTSPIPTRLDHRIGHFALGIITRIFFGTYGRMRVLGTENIPKTGALIFAANHASYLDPLVGWSAIWGHRLMIGVARHEIWKNRFVAYVLTCMGSIPVHRHKADVAMLRQCLEVLGKGETVGIFPEGTRTYDGLLNPAEPGLGLLYHKSQAPIVPVALIGTYEMFPRGAKMLKRARLTVIMGTPLTFSKETSREEIGEVVMREIAKLMTENGKPTLPPTPERAALLPKGE